MQQKFQPIHQKYQGNEGKEAVKIQKYCINKMSNKQFQHKTAKQGQIHFQYAWNSKTRSKIGKISFQIFDLHQNE